MFENSKSFEDRLRHWAEFRKNINNVKDPIQATIDQYNRAPSVSIHTDPYDRSTWPTPWELIKENQYCAFCKLLGIAYTLQLTDCFSTEPFEIHIQRSDETSETFYLLVVGDRVVGYQGDTHVAKADLPSHLLLQQRYTLSP
jgi:hypothetical protein